MVYTNIFYLQFKGDLLMIADKMQQLSSAIFSELNKQKKALMKTGRSMIDFSIGTPDSPPSEYVMKLLSKATKDPLNYRYAISDSHELIEAVTHWYRQRYEVVLETDEIVSLLGSQSGFTELALCLINPGDIVLVPSPSYPIFTIGPHLAGATLHKMPLLKENNYLIDFKAIPEHVAQAAKLIIVSYPNNPTAATAPPSFYKELVAFAKRYNIIVLHDNAYSELLFDGNRGESFLNTPGAKEVGIEFNSLSKTYSIPGCRIAFAVGNKEIIGALKTLKSHVDYGMFLPFQKVAVSLLTGPQDEVKLIHDLYERRGQFLIQGLKEIGWDIPLPKGSMFIWAPIPSHYTSSMQFTQDLMHQAGVVVVPGISFGYEGEGYVRLALVQNEDAITKAIEQIQASNILKSNNLFK